MNNGLFFAFGASVLWGLAYVIDQKVLVHVTPLAFLFTLSLITVISLLPLVLTGTIDLTTVTTARGSSLVLIVGAAALGIVANFFILSSIGALGASTASLLEITYPAFVVVFSIFILGTAPAWPVLAGGALIIAGSAIIVRSLS
jgi:drug/metabolite transporter (DMT)-like permease